MEGGTGVGGTTVSVYWQVYCYRRPRGGTGGGGTTALYLQISKFIVIAHDVIVSFFNELH